MDEVIKFFGSKAKMARALGVERSAVSLWIKKGYFPPLRAIQIEELSCGEFRASRLIQAGAAVRFVVGGNDE